MSELVLIATVALALISDALDVGRGMMFSTESWKRRRRYLMTALRYRNGDVDTPLTADEQIDDFLVGFPADQTPKIWVMIDAVLPDNAGDQYDASMLPAIIEYAGRESPEWRIGLFKHAKTLEPPNMRVTKSEEVMAEEDTPDLVRNATGPNGPGTVTKARRLTFAQLQKCGEHVQAGFTDDVDSFKALQEVLGEGNGLDFSFKPPKI